MATELSLSGVAPVAHHEADVAAADYLQTRGWLYADHFGVGGSGALTFDDEAVLWKAALRGHGIYETRRLTLEDVVLTEWVPRSPGRYHTPEAKSAREDAQYRIAERHGDHVVYDPWGKTSMVQGGVGCLRLAMKDFGGRQVKFLGATTSGIVHQSFVVAVDGDQYASIADTIDKRGGVRCTIAGTVRFWTADEKLNLFMARDVPRVYLGIDELRRGAHSPTDLPPLDVTPAVTFDAAGKEYFTYSHFAPADSGHVARAVEWMDQYVRERYRGRMLTDFDELVPRFADTAAPLTTLMDLEVSFERIAAALAHHVSVGTLTVITNKFGEVVVGDRYEITGSQVGSVGPGARAEDMTFVLQTSQEIDPQVLADELRQLRLALKERGTEAQQDLAVGEVAAAEVAAKQGDTDGALRHLKQAGRWALGVAEEIGVPVATAALRSVLG